MKYFSSSLILISPQPETQHAPIPRATTAAWEVIPPRTVRIPSDTCIPSISSGEVSRRTRITLCPSAVSSIASSAENTICPQAAPGDAGNALAIGFALFKSASSKRGCSRESNCFGSTIIKASSLVIMPSSTISHAIFKAEAAVRFPLRVCSMNRLPFSMVNSISCIFL